MVIEIKARPRKYPNRYVATMAERNKSTGNKGSENDLFLYIFNTIKVIIRVGTIWAKK